MIQPFDDDLTPTNYKEENQKKTKKENESHVRRVERNKRETQRRSAKQPIFFGSL